MASCIGDDTPADAVNILQVRSLILFNLEYTKNLLSVREQIFIDNRDRIGMNITDRISHFIPALQANPKFQTQVRIIRVLICVLICPICVVCQTQLRIIRVMKPLRWFKLARIMKLNRMGHVITRLADQYGLEPKHQRLMMLAFRILGLIHIGGCIVWLVKVTSEPEEQVHNFLNSQSPEYESDVELSTANGKLFAYGLSVYFVTTVFSTVGFGDMSATNPTERITYCFLMMYGVMVFGDLLSELAEINHATRTQEIEQMEVVQAAVDFMAGHDVPKCLSRQVLNWTRFFHTHSKGNMRKSEFLHSLPTVLQSELVELIFGETLRKVPIFEVLLSEYKTFLRDVWVFMQYNHYTPDSPIVDLGDKAMRLIVVVSGKMTVYVESYDRKNIDTCLLKTGDFLGDFALLGDLDWGSSTLINRPNCNIEASSNPENFVVCLELHASDFQSVIRECENHMQMKAAIDRFEMDRREHRMAAMAEGVNSLTEGIDFARHNHLIMCWSRLAIAYVKKHNGQGVTDEFAQKLQRSFSVKRKEGNAVKDTKLVLDKWQYGKAGTETWAAVLLQRHWRTIRERRRLMAGKLIDNAEGRGQGLAKRIARTNTISSRTRHAHAHLPGVRGHGAHGGATAVPGISREQAHNQSGGGRVSEEGGHMMKRVEDMFEMIMSRIEGQEQRLVAILQYQQVR